MEKRSFDRVTVDVPAMVIFTLADNSNVECDGVLHNISEGGVQIKLEKEDYDAIAPKLKIGDVIGFKAVDVYQVFSDKREDIVQGNVEVIWVSEADREIAIGGKLNYVSSDYLSYVKNKKLSTFIIKPKM